MDNLCDICGAPTEDDSWICSTCQELTEVPDIDELADEEMDLVDLLERNY